MFDMNNAYVFAEVSKATYLTDPTEVRETLGRFGLKLDKAYSTTQAHSDGPQALLALVCHDHENVVLAFRGTVRFNWELVHLTAWLANWIMNTSFDQLPYLGGKIHRGFAEAANLLREPLLSQITPHLDKGRRLWITGHSLGGALAALTASHFAQQRYDGEYVRPVGVYTYGSPRIGDPIFSNNYTVPLYRFEYHDDVVAHLVPPPELLEFLRSDEFARVVAWFSKKVQNGATFLGADGETSAAIERFFASLLKLVQDASKVEYKHAGSLKFLDWENDCLEPDTPFKGMVLSGMRGAHLTGQLISDVLDLHKPECFKDHSLENYVGTLKAIVA